MKTDETQISILDKNDGDVLPIAGGMYRIVGDGRMTQGTLAFIEMVVPPEGGPGPHAHPEMAEAFYVLEGEVEVTSEQGSRRVGKGGFVFIPRGGAVHQFKNTSSAEARLLCVVSPAGLEDFFRAMGSLAAPPPAGQASRPPDPEAAKRTAERFGQILYSGDYFSGAGVKGRAP